MRGQGGAPDEKFGRNENFKPEQKKMPFWVKNSGSWARSALLHGILLSKICKFAITRKNDAFVAKIA